MKNEGKQAQYERAERLLAEQNFVGAMVIGAAATILAALGYAIVVMKWPFSYGFATAGIGAAVGIAMQFLGRGIDTGFAVAAAGYTVVGAGLGNLFLPILPQVTAGTILPGQILKGSVLAEAAETATSLLSGGYLIYLLVAVFAAVFLARRPLSRADRFALGVFRMQDRA